MNNEFVWFNAIEEENSMERKELSQLLYELEQELLRLGYKDGTLLFYKRRWKALMEYAKERGETYFTEQLGIDFARECLGIPQDNIAKRLTQSQTQDLRVIRMIGDFQLHDCIADSENVAQQNIAESLWRSVEKLKKLFKKAM